MAAVGAVGGVGYFRIDGVQYSVRGDVKVRLGGIVRESIRNVDNTDGGWTEKPMVPGVDLTLADAGGLTMGQFQAITNSTTTWELNNGKTFVLTGTRQVGELELDAMEGKLAIKFDGAFITEVPTT